MTTVASTPEAVQQVTGLIDLLNATGWDTRKDETYHDAEVFPSNPDQIMLAAHIVYRVLARRGLETVDAMWSAWDTHPDGTRGHVRFLSGVHYTPQGGEAFFGKLADFREHVRQTAATPPRMLAEKFTDDELLDALTLAPQGMWRDHLKAEARHRLNRPAKALEIAVKYGDIDGGHHKQWVIDQMMKALGHHGLPNHGIAP